MKHFRRFFIIAKNTCMFRRVWPHVSARLLLDGLPWHLMLEASVEVCRGYRALYVEAQVRFSVVGDIISPQNIVVQHYFYVVNSDL